MAAGHFKIKGSAWEVNGGHVGGDETPGGFLCVRRKIQLVQTMPSQDQFYRSLFPISNFGFSCHNHHHDVCVCVRFCFDRFDCH